MEQKQIQEQSETLFYLDMWKSEEQNNDKAKKESFENSQKDEEVIKEQQEQDKEISEGITTEKETLKDIPIFRIRG